MLVIRRKKDDEKHECIANTRTSGHTRGMVTDLKTRRKREATQTLIKLLISVTIAYYSRVTRIRVVITNESQLQ